MRISHAAQAPFQAEGAFAAVARRRLLIADEMGAGKTLQAIAALAGIRGEGGWPALVVCPAGCRSMCASEQEKGESTSLQRGSHSREKRIER